MPVQEPEDILLGSSRHYNVGCTKVFVLCDGATDGAIVRGATVRNLEIGPE